MLKKSLALLLVLATAVGALAGCTGGAVEDNVAKFADQLVRPDIDNYVTPNLNGVTLELYMPANDDFEAEGCYADQAIEKTLNMNLVIHELDSFDSQYNPLLAEGNIPSLTMRNSWTNANNMLGEDGAMINILRPEVLEAMPHVKWYLENTEEGRNFVRDYSYEEGVLYGVPIIEYGTAAVYGYLYRKDIFADNNMTFPTNQDEFYNTLMKLKSLYPSSYPFVLRGLSGTMGSLSTWGYNWGVGHTVYGVKNSILTLQNGQYVYAPTSDIYKEEAMYVKKLLGEGLLHPSSMTMDTSGWTEAFASNKSFISFDKMDRLPSLNLAGQSLNPNFKLVGTSGFAMGSNGRAETQAVDSVIRTWMIGNNDQIVTTLQYVDWLYSNQGIDITNWGVEGETYTVDAEGNKSLIMDKVQALGSFNATGFGMAGIAGIKDFNSFLSACDEDMKMSVQVCMSKAVADPQILLAYSGDDQLAIDTYAVSCTSYATNQLGKFIMGYRDFSEWDAYVNEVNTKYHMSELKTAHENAYKKALERQSK